MGGRRRLRRRTSAGVANADVGAGGGLDEHADRGRVDVVLVRHLHQRDLVLEGVRELQQPATCVREATTTAAGTPIQATLQTTSTHTLSWIFDQVTTTSDYLVRQSRRVQ